MKPANFIIIVSIVLSSCAAVKPPPLDKTLALNSDNYKLLDGTYKNIGTNKYSGSATHLWLDLTYLNPCSDIPPETDRTFLNDTAFSCKSCYVKIQSINAHKITANLISGKTVLKTMQLNGRITDGAFLLKRRHAYKFPGLVFFWATGSWDVQFSINNDKELVVNGAEDCIAAILILPLISSHSQSESIYKRN